MAENPQDQQQDEPPSQDNPAPQEFFGTPENPFGGEIEPAIVPSIAEFYVPPLRTESPPVYMPPFQSGYGNAHNQPRSFGQSIRELPRQYLRMYTQPGAATFAQELGKANWAIVWFQVLVLAFAGAIFTFVFFWLFSLIFSSILTNTPASATTPVYQSFPTNIMFTFFPLLSVAVVVLTPASFFFNSGIIFWIAKAFKGQGTFLAQCYALLLVSAPLAVFTFVVALIPFVGSLASFGLSVYAIVLQIYALMAVHRVSGGKAALIYFIPWIVGALLFIVFFAFWLYFVFSTLRY